MCILAAMDKWMGPALAACWITACGGETSRAGPLSDTDLASTGDAVATSSTGSPDGASTSNGSTETGATTDEGTTTDASGSTGDRPPLHLPGGRPNYVVALMGTKPNASWVRLATWAFAEDGVIEEHFWYWDQTQAPVQTDPYLTRTNTGYETAGCPEVCDVWTTTGFEPGAWAPHVRTGEWVFDEQDRVAITWSSGFHETYAVVEHDTYTELTLAEHEYAGVSAMHAAVFGSHASLDAGVSIADIHDTGTLDFVIEANNWDAATHHNDGTIYWSTYFECSGSPSVQGMAPDVYHTYFASDPAVDGRKTYWYHQLTEVALTPDCANIERGGHTYELLQILDDAGEFVGFVGVETSLLGQYTGGSIVSHMTALRGPS